MDRDSDTASTRPETAESEKTVGKHKAVRPLPRLGEWGPAVRRALRERANDRPDDPTDRDDG